VPLVVDCFSQLASLRDDGVVSQRTSLSEPAVSCSLRGQRHHEGGSKGEPHVCAAQSMGTERLIELIGSMMLREVCVGMCEVDENSQKQPGSL
jgi:hypothetical protein